MKKRWIFWWLVTILWMIILGAGTAFIWLREVDGAGVIQTPEAKFASFIVLLIAFLFPILIQVIWLIVNLVTNSNKKYKSA
ncbi:DUF3923 family protein [Lederbergia galactosidilytica]|uniref:Membrane protein n=1 Tax=Lederbergia galactosidilytica TaxID=217031 RepID=A0A0Q9YIR3_9BACI|nr:DUF3923 family protein [Lederbergia galactosidilytica]KRG14902.1 membrane protein [Virgibacillus soli]KRG16910.1 membrane protein [Lederbergia galactosidilytica]MBP1914590.1 hypothetical protein [Lederbergia galactosidilytica]OAK69151.1 membrane protein [Lederbergia galactosidilytica]